MLTVYKASAGSGKTFRLVFEYLKILLARPNNYRNVLAVTFTNKATAEMKERILEHLGKLAGGRNSPYRELLQLESGLAESQIRDTAQIILEKLLFDFDRFSVSTIDKFNQKLIKAFNREVGISPNYMVETDTELLIAEAVDRIFAKVDQNPGLFSWLRSFVEEKIKNSRSFAIEADLKKLGNELFREKLQNNITLLTHFFKGSGNDRMYLDMLNAIIRGFEKKLKDQAGILVHIYEAAAYTAEDFLHGMSGVAGFLEKTALGNWNETIGVRVVKAAESAENWVTRNNPKAAEIKRFAQEKLIPGLKNLLTFIDGESRKYFTARAIFREWYSTALLVNLNEEIAELSREKGILPLANSNLLLKGIIDGSEVPFIFEKAGNTWNYFLLDEFQDTSEMQWENFKPLISNALSNEYPSLVVGDVKQSIYRWRNSNWNLLYHRIYNDFPHVSVTDIHLDANFRSGRNIVEFNNVFFGLFSKSMADFPKILNAAPFRHQIEDIYADLRQKSKAIHGPDGFVSIEQLGDQENEFETASLKRLPEQIKELYNKGFTPGDIAILVRRKDQGALIVRYFLEIAQLPENHSVPFRILSGESLFLKSSATVVFIVHIMSCLIKKQDSLAKGIVMHLLRNYIAPFSAGNGVAQGGLTDWVPYPGWEQEYDLVIQSQMATIETKSLSSGLDELIVHICEMFGLFKIGSELPYLQTLIDQAIDLKKNNIHDIPGFLHWWEEDGREVSVRINENVDAIRLLTIHSAKGLEYKVVLIPFLDWKITGPAGRDILWCVPSDSPFRQAPLVPVRYSDQLAKTCFSDDYYQELTNLLIDNLNLVYVAFTRAVSVLWVNVPFKNDSGEIGSFLNQALMDLATQSGYENTWNKQERRFTIGNIPVQPVISEIQSGSEPPGWFFTDFTGKMVLRVDSDDFLQITDSGKSKKNLGKVLHAILAEIKTTSDVDAACKKALASGYLLPEEWTESVKRLKTMTEHPEAGDWFSGNWKVLTEIDLLSPEMTLRPDRIMLKEDQAVIVDYKTGDLKLESHVRQVKRYKDLLQKTGITVVKGYLWYMQENELVEV